MKPIFAVLAALALLLAGCQAYPMAPANPPPSPTCEELAQQEQSPENLSFETIARESYNIPWRESEWTDPELFVLTSADDISAIEQYIAPDVVAALKATNFDDAVVLAAFSGWMPHAAWQFCVTSITQQQNKILLHTHLIDSPVAPATIAFYYHLLQLAREELPTGEITFSLALTTHRYVALNGQTVLEASQEEIVASVTRSLP